jgi:D-lactate dehydrogenase (cytochrome)
MPSSFRRSTAEVQAVVAACAADGCPMTPFGAGSSLEGHVIPLQHGVTIDLSRMNRVLRPERRGSRHHGRGRHDAQAARQAPAVHRALVPLDPGADATIGGMAATRASGTTAVRYGTMRDAVSASPSVTADGRAVRTGTRARKSSAGYDLTRLFVGAEGTLGIITELTLRLHGRPEAIAAATCWFDSIDDAVNAVIMIVQLGFPVARIELLDETMMDAVNRHSKMNRPVAPTLFFEFHGLSEASVEEHAQATGDIIAEHGAHDYARATSPEDRAKLWQARHDAYYAALALRPGARSWTTDVCVPISRLAECIHRRRRISPTRPARSASATSATATSTCSCRDPDSASDMAAAERLVDRLVARSLAMGGTCTGEHGGGLGQDPFLEAEPRTSRRSTSCGPSSMHSTRGT